MNCGPLSTILSVTSIATHIEVKFTAGTPNKKTEWVYVIAIWNSFHTQCGKFLDSQSTVEYIWLFGKIIDVPYSKGKWITCVLIWKLWWKESTQYQAITIWEFPVFLKVVSIQILIDFCFKMFEIKSGYFLRNIFFNHLLNCACLWFLCWQMIHLGVLKNHNSSLMHVTLFSTNDTRHL